MATTTIPRTAIKGGSFLIESCRPEEIFSPADLSDDQKLIGQTAEEFVTKEVLPLANELEQHKEGLLPEPQAGSDAQNARTRAVLSPDGKHWILNGQKMWITNGGFADVYIVFAKVNGEKFSCFIVERGHPGFSVGAEEKKMGIKGSSTVPIFFENCQVPRENLLHEIGRGHIVAFNILNVGRYSLGAYCVGGTKKVLETSSKYAKERTAFGKP